MLETNVPAGCPVPSAEQIEAWWHEATGPEYGLQPQHIALATAAATWAAERQLDRCSQWLGDHHGDAVAMVRDCRPTDDKADALCLAFEAMERILSRRHGVVQRAEDIAFITSLMSKA